MATYKVPQNVEAEDKLLGPFTFRQFLYLMVAAFAIFMAWLLAQISLWLIIIPLPVIIIFGILGIYHREDQPVESYLLAALNYFIKPRKRKWSPEGDVETVRITAPKRVPTPKLRVLANERGQLQRLGQIMDTRGWSIKQPELTEPRAEMNIDLDDRLVVPDAPSAEEPIDVHNYEDVLDPVNYRDAQKYSELAQSGKDSAKARALAKMQKAIGKDQHQAKSNKQKGKLPTKLKYDPFPSGLNQTVLKAGSGKVATRRKIDPAIKKLAQNQDAPVSEIARQAQELAKGKEIDLPHSK